MAFATINKAALPKATTTNTPAKMPAIEEAFTSEPSLRKRIYDAIGNTPQHASLFEDIARYTTTLLARSTTSTTQKQDTQQQQQHTVPVDMNDDGPAAKKRKVQNGDTPGAGAHSGDFKTESSLQFYMPDVSFAIPQRKKLTLEVAGGRGYLRTRNQTSKEVEFGVAMDKIQHVVCVPVPEKTQKQFNLCIIPEYSDGINPAPEGETASEAMVWAVNDGPPKAAFSGTGQPMALGEGETAEKLIRRILDNNLSRTKVITPDEREFVSATPEAHRKGEKAYHVKAFRGSKEGYLFLLSTGILFGFKKPLLFFAFANIESVSYTSILQRTFNLNIMARPMTSDETQEIEFSMIDQADFAGIDGYIKKHGLQDASLADTRRAKVYNVNGAKNDSSAEANPDGAGGEAHESELQKAERELDDQEDEDEEDYDPGSDDDSDGSGSSSEGSDDDGDDDDDDDDEGEEDEDDEDGEKNIVAEELGSEAEDVAEEL